MDESIARRYRELCEALQLDELPHGFAHVRERLSMWAKWAVRTGHGLENIGLTEYVHWLSNKDMPPRSIDDHIVTIVDMVMEARERLRGAKGGTKRLGT